MSYLTEQNIDSPLSRWQFEETSGTTIDDDLTATRDGTINGTVILNQPKVFPDGGLGADFNGSNGYVSMGNMSGLLGIGTIEAVVQFDTIPASNPNPIFAHAFTGGILPLVLGFNLNAASPGLLQVGYFTGSVWVAATWSTAPLVNKPYHLVGKYDGTTLKLRANGVEVASSTVGTARPGSGTVNATAYIGRRWDLAHFHDGKIWDVAIYASALSDARSNAHYFALANPLADDFANALAAADGGTVAGIDTTAWTLESGEPGSLTHSGWAQFTPPTTKIYRIDTIGSNFDTVLNIYTGAALNSLTLIASDDDSGGSSTSLLNVTLTGGTTYYIQVGAQPAGSGGLLSFSLQSLAESRVGALATEALAESSPPARRVSAVAVETVGDQIRPASRVSGVVVEVLLPIRIPYRGWGSPMINNVWQ